VFRQFVRRICEKCMRPRRIAHLGRIGRPRAVARRSRELPARAISATEVNAPVERWVPDDMDPNETFAVINGLTLSLARSAAVPIDGSTHLRATFGAHQRSAEPCSRGPGAMASRRGVRVRRAAGPSWALLGRLGVQALSRDLVRKRICEQFLLGQADNTAGPDHFDISGITHLHSYFRG